MCTTCKEHIWLYTMYNINHDTFIRIDLQGNCEPFNSSNANNTFTVATHASS